MSEHPGVYKALDRVVTLLERLQQRVVKLEELAGPEGVIDKALSTHTQQVDVDRLRLRKLEERIIALEGKS